MTAKAARRHTTIRTATIRICRTSCSSDNDFYYADKAEPDYDASGHEYLTMTATTMAMAMDMPSPL